ncbi:MAG: alpha/beta hydrolase [Acidobacteria bacterium]|nr:MAG: alpha/beta hydrolase [Acidobacteriota bacterium]
MYNLLMRFVQVWLVCLFSFAVLSAESPSLQNPEPIRIWKGPAPGSDAQHWPTPGYHEEWERPGEVLTGITDPSIQVFLPDAAVNTGQAVIICPGGGYRNLWINKEGWKVAAELQKRGIAGIVLKYRHYDRNVAVQDAHRAVRYVRSRAREWHLNEKMIGIGGFSAGGHLSLNMAGQLRRTPTWTSDEIDQLSNRPDFLMVIYPGVRLLAEAVIDASFPPAFITVAADDQTTKAVDTIDLFSRLQALQVKSELHVYQAGGHGFGLGTPECNCGSWLDLFQGWVKTLTK